MDLQQIETADCNILNIKVASDKIIINFESVYDLKSKSYINEVGLFVCNWTSFSARVFITDDPLKGSYFEKKLSLPELEYFEWVQRILIKDNQLVLQGYSRESGNWLEYSFLDSEFRLKKSPIKPD